jgi:hypothetical protein
MARSSKNREDRHSLDQIPAPQSGRVACQAVRPFEAAELKHTWRALLVASQKFERRSDAQGDTSGVRKPPYFARDEFLLRRSDGQKRESRPRVSNEGRRQMAGSGIFPQAHWRHMMEDFETRELGFEALDHLHCPANNRDAIAVLKDTCEDRAGQIATCDNRQPHPTKLRKPI